MKIIVIKVLTSAVGGSKIRLLLLDVMDLLLLHTLGIYILYALWCGGFALSIIWYHSVEGINHGLVAVCLRDSSNKICICHIRKSLIRRLDKFTGPNRDFNLSGSSILSVLQADLALK